VATAVSIYPFFIERPIRFRSTTTSRTNLIGILDEAVRQLAYVDQAVLVDTDVHEGTEGRNVRDDAGQEHARPQVVDGVNVGKRKSL